MEENIFKWLNDWYIKNCDGDWEHYYGIKIETIDNPGWTIEIDTEGSLYELQNIPWTFFEKCSSDWYGYKVEEKKFEASGDHTKLEFLINLFKELTKR
jgi:Immunity protein 53